MVHADVLYKDSLRYILENGELTPNRTGVDTISVFSPPNNKYDLREGFPLLTTKKIDFEAVKAELFFFLKGSTNVNDLPEKYRFIWLPWARKDGDLGPIYGNMWTRWTENIDNGCCSTWEGCGCEPPKVYNQIQILINTIKKDPTSRRLIVSAWNVGKLEEMVLLPCHIFFQCRVSKGFLDLTMYQRSADAPIGIPYNISSYALLLSMLAKECNLVPRFFTHVIGDLHIYQNQMEGVEKQLEREPYASPTIKIADKPFWDLKAEDIELLNYKSHSFIRFPVAV